MSERRFDAAYREEVTLRDGSRAQLRLVQPGDKHLFVHGMQRLSPQSRYLRFFTGKESLSEAELRYLTELDGEGHLAIGAISTTDGNEVGLGVARYVRLGSEPDVAEVAVTVIDPAQRKGLGRILLERVVEAARERGIRRFRAEILPSNAAIKGLVSALAASVHHDEEGCLIVDFDLPEQRVPEARHTLIEQLLAMAARGLIAVRRAFDRDD